MGVDWQEQTDESIDGIVFGIRHGFYPLDPQGRAVLEAVEAKVQEICPYYEDRDLQAYSLTVGFMMGQIGERLKHQGTE